MNDKKLKSFLVSGWILTALLIIEDLFLIYCAVLNIFSMNLTSIECLQAFWFLPLL